MILHTLNCNDSSESFRDCLRMAQGGDAILLLGDGVYGALANSESARALRDCPAKVMALDTDVLAAGLENRLGQTLLVDMDGFVALSEYYPRQLAWY
jgi:tRNA 2-thiouridine synthesizing protein B